MPGQRGQAGQTIVEVLVAMGLAAVLLPALLTMFVASRASRTADGLQLQATGLLREANEAVRVARNRDWAQVATNGTYHPAIASNSWALVAGSETIGYFTRSVVVADARRDSSGQLVASGGTTDPSTKLVTTTVSWGSSAATTVSDTAYLSRFGSEAAWSQTTQSDFAAGTTTGTAVTNTGGGEVQLAANGSPPPAFATSGTYESATFDAGAAAGWQYLTFAATRPAGTDVQLQIAVNDDNATWNYVGPDGTSSTSYTNPGAVPLAAGAGRYARYKATFSGDGSATATLSDVTVGYTP